MIVVVEGPDGAGKSTLIDNLRVQSKRHFVALRRSGPPDHPAEITSVINWINTMRDGLVPLICDRHPLISEPIYGMTLRGSNILSNVYSVEDLKSMFKYIDRVIYCRPPDRTILSKMHENAQLKGVTEHIEKIIDLYDKTMMLLEEWGVRVIAYDWTGADLTRKFTGRTCDLHNLFFGDR